MLFADRHDAGRRLAAELLRFKDQRPVVLALPRGGVPVAFEIATALAAPLDLVLVRKIGHPWSPELAIGAIAEGDGIETVTNDRMADETDVPQRYLDEEIARQTREIEKRRRLYFKGRSAIDIRQRTAIVVDDGIATGATMHVALHALRKRAPAKLVMAVPVAPAAALDSFRSEADEVVCLAAPEEFGAVSVFYADFRPVEDNVVVDLLEQAFEAQSRSSQAP